MYVPFEQQLSSHKKKDFLGMGQKRENKRKLIFLFTGGNNDVYEYIIQFL